MIRRQRLRLVALPAVLSLPLLVATAGPATATSSGPRGCGPIAYFAPGNFPDGSRVDNRWFPLRPGANFVMKGTVTEDGVAHAHRIMTTVTDLTKLINGVRTVVVFDRDYNDGELEEAELAFMAQDADGNVWNVGEYPEEYDNGVLTGAPSTWVTGVAAAQAGIGMRTAPHVGDGAYLQGKAPRIGFRDCAQVVRTGQRVCVPDGCYDRVLVTDEWAPFAPKEGHQRKYYAPGVGNIRIDAVGGDTPEVMRLAELTMLSPEALHKVRTEVLRQDRRGYRVSPDVYGRTPPVE